MNVKINDAETPFNFIVLPYMSQEVILGADFMDTYACNIDFASKTISFFNGSVSIEVIDLQAHKNQNRSHAFRHLYVRASFRNNCKCVL